MQTALCGASGVVLRGMWLTLLFLNKIKREKIPACTVCNKSIITYVVDAVLFYL